ncbi:hypothetical protein ACFE04_013247 [Oxalis oulophora]
MDFFKSVFADDLDASISPDSTSSSSAEPDTDNHPEPNSEPNPNTSVWSFNNLIKTLASKSETYRREFNDGLMKEASVISSVVDKGTTVAQESLESVGQAIDDIGSTVSHIISYGIAYNNNNDINNDNDNDISISSNGKAYSRYENQLRVLQCDEATYCSEVEDKDREEYERWKEGFVIDEGLVNENVVGMEIFNNVVPSRVADRDVFWTRYFYRVYKLRQGEDARVRLVKRFMDGEDDEDLGWDFDDDNDDEDDDKVESSVGKGSDISIVPSQEEDLGSDEIVGNGSKGELRKQRVSSANANADADKDEDLSWDIEDDEEEQVK